MKPCKQPSNMQKMPTGEKDTNFGRHWDSPLNSKCNEAPELMAEADFSFPFLEHNYKYATQPLVNGTHSVNLPLGRRTTT